MDTNYRRLRRATQSVSEYPGRCETTWTADKPEGTYTKRKLRKTFSNPEEYYTKNALTNRENKDDNCGQSQPEMNNGKLPESTEEAGQPSLSYFAYLGDNSNRQRKKLYEMYGITRRRSSIKVNPVLQKIQENDIWNGSLPKMTNESSFSTTPRDDDDISVAEYRYMNAVDCCTCMCCVRGLIYHLTKDQDNEGNLQLCYCTDPSMNCFIQWSVIGVLTLFMPCLVLYPFLKGGFSIYKNLKRSLKKKHKKENIIHYKK